MGEGIVKIISAFIVALLAGAFLVVHIVRKSRRDKTKTVQKNNIVGRDQAGRDIIKGKRD